MEKIINGRITQSELKELITYDPNTGIMKWRKKNRHSKPENVCDGYYNNKGYLLLCINYRQYVQHQLAWLYITGSWPKEQLDHIDGKRDNNIFSNLREATNRQNCYNKFAKGFYLNKERGKYMSRIRVDGKDIFLGWFNNKIDARKSYIEACEIYQDREFIKRKIAGIAL